MIKAIDVEWKGNLNKRAYLALLVADETPSSLEITGADVEDMDDDTVITAGSIMYTPDGTYMAYSDGVFAQKA